MDGVLGQQHQVSPLAGGLLHLAQEHLQVGLQHPQGLLPGGLGGDRATWSTPCWCTLQRPG